MSSRILLIFFACFISVVSTRNLGPFPDNPLLKIFIVNVDIALYHDDCKLYEPLLQKVLHGRLPKDALIYCYKEIESGFAAKLTDEEAEKLRGEEGVFEVDEQKRYSNEGYAICGGLKFFPSCRSVMSTTNCINE